MLLGKKGKHGRMMDTKFFIVKGRLFLEKRGMFLSAKKSLFDLFEPKTDKETDGKEGRQRKESIRKGRGYPSAA